MNVLSSFISSILMIALVSLLSGYVPEFDLPDTSPVIRIELHAPANDAEHDSECDC